MLTFPDFLKELRKKANITQNDLAEMLHVSKMLIVMVEANTRNPSDKFISKLAKILGVNETSLRSFKIQDDLHEIKINPLEKALLNVVKKLQLKIIEKGAIKLKIKSKKPYPTLKIDSKNILAKRISSKKLSAKQSLSLINFCKSNKNDLWKDHKDSDPKKEKYIRSARPKLNKLLKLIDTNLLKKHDNLLPSFICGGISKRSSLGAAKKLIGKGKSRFLLKMDLKRFFDQISRKDVYHLFYDKLKCSKSGSNLIADLCCVPKGPKNSPQKEMAIARGFPTSGRIAVWANLDFFLAINGQIKKNQKIKDYRYISFVDDIGITINGDKRELEELRDKIFVIAKKYKIAINPKKTEINPIKDHPEILGVKLGKKKLSAGDKTIKKFKKNKAASKTSKSKKERKKAEDSKKGTRKYLSRIKKINNSK